MKWIGAILLAMALPLSGCGKPAAPAMATQAQPATVQTIPEPKQLEIGPVTAWKLPQRYQVRCNQEDITGILSDDSYTTGRVIYPGNRLTIESEQPFSSLYLQWDALPGEYAILWDGQRKVCGREGFQHEFVRLEQAVTQVTFAFSEGVSPGISELSLYTAGDPPEGVQEWLPPCEQADMLVFPTHADDDVLYFGALMCYYSRELDWVIQTAFLTDHQWEPERRHERLDGLWELGLRYYPVVWDAPDLYSESLAKARSQYGAYDIVAWQVEQIRRFRPQMVVGHDLEGEYGHGAHRLNAASLIEAVPLAAQPEAYPDSEVSYGVWQTPETYLHLYEGEALPLDVNKPLTEDSRTPFEVAQDAYLHHHSQQKWRFSVTQEDPRETCTKFGKYVW